jgi:hypothetical protein
MLDGYLYGSDTGFDESLNGKIHSAFNYQVTKNSPEVSNLGASETLLFSIRIMFGQIFMNRPVCLFQRVECGKFAREFHLYAPVGQ